MGGSEPERPRATERATEAQNPDAGHATQHVPTEVWINRPVPALPTATTSIEEPSVGELWAASGAVAGGPGTEIARGDGAASAVHSSSTLGGGLAELAAQ